MSEKAPVTPAVRMLREMRQVRRAAASGAYDIGHVDRPDGEPDLSAPGEIIPPRGL